MRFSDSKLLWHTLREFFPYLENDENELVKAYFKVITFYTEHFCANLKKIRIEKQFSQKELSRLLKVTPTSYSAWETGIHTPKIDYIKSLSEIFQVDPAVFITFEFNKTESYKKIPILDKSWFSATAFPDFLEILKNPQAKSVLSYDYVCTGSLEEFCFDYGNSNDMKGRNSGIAPFSLITCTSSPFIGKTQEEIYEYVDGNVCIVSINGGNGMVRQVFYDGSFLRLHAWNKAIDDRIFPVRRGFLSSLGNLAKVALNPNTENHEDVLLAKDVTFYGVAIKSILDVQSIQGD